MGKSRFWLYRLIYLIVCALASVSALAVDLQAIDAYPIKVGACDHQVRFNVKVSPQGNEYAAKNVLASYRIGVYSARNKALLTTFSVSEQKIGDSFVFVVPSKLLTCEKSVIIVVDDKKKTSDTNRKNNTVVVSWKNSGKVFGSTCAVQLESCRK